MAFLSYYLGLFIFLSIFLTNCSENETDSSVPYETVSLTGRGPQGVDIDSETGYVYVATNGSVISGCTGDGEIGELTSYLNVINAESGTVSTTTETEGGAIWPLVDNGSRNRIYVAGSASGKVAVHSIETGLKISSIDLGGAPHALLLSEDGLLMVSNTKDATQTYRAVVDLENSNSITHYLAPTYPHGIVSDLANGVFYMVGVLTGEVTVINQSTGTTVENFSPIENANNSNLLAWSETKRKLFIANTQTSSSVTVYDVDARTQLGVLSFSDTSHSVWGMDIDEESGLLFAALPNLNAVGVASVDTLEVYGTFAVDECPYTVKLDITRGRGYTTGQVNGTLSIFSIDAVKAKFGL